MNFNETVAVSAGSIQSFYIYLTAGGVSIPDKSSSDDPILLSDDNLKILALARTVGYELWCWVAIDEVSL
eukprot:scaffold127213_cov73-Cyclotella_meneghiniana.AAC.1